MIHNDTAPNSSGSWEIIVNTKRIIEKEGSTVPGLHGPRVHPEIGISKDAKQQLLRALQQLELDDYFDDPILKGFS